MLKNLGQRINKKFIYYFIILLLLLINYGCNSNKINEEKLYGLWQYCDDDLYHEILFSKNNKLVYRPETYNYWFIYSYDLNGKEMQIFYDETCDSLLFDCSLEFINNDIVKLRMEKCQNNKEFNYVLTRYNGKISLDQYTNVDNISQLNSECYERKEKFSCK